MWQQRKCNIIMHTIAAVICIFSETPKCGIPLSFWLAVQFMFMTLESASMELKERMQQSLYWSATSNRRCRKWITGVCGATKELSEIAWQVYGAKLYFSDESDGCSEENQGFMFVLVMFLCIAALKVILISCFLCIVVVAFGARKLKRRNERSASRDILRSLGRIKYSTLSIGQSEPDEECSICFSEYGEDDELPNSAAMKSTSSTSSALLTGSSRVRIHARSAALQSIARLNSDILLTHFTALRQLNFYLLDLP
eukprot:CAMPEP_0185578462 /NCGR_PEP_ID=MMETSP0434-20130131/12949_1 /TAXON_ID=626734 ORGANISM="Favella taraikaensis, Strain Fe Narragansett Bay" /NCGR_SAMPLE_ID=MMETSP0434 /ASSEMBLY_ACC=CAM_ASM_000379 /LENGTH=254 /DNA_ID=CAMNT_0028196275 /DNA_START=422 /DNA_END=1183 /DNA_ORIENTATION=-